MVNYIHEANYILQAGSAMVCGPLVGKHWYKKGCYTHARARV
jgi:hypothetical protein